MNVEKIFDDVLIFKSKVLSSKKRQKISDEIYRIQDKLKPFGIIGLDEKVLLNQSDFDLVTILSHQYILFTIKYFQENSH